MCLSLFFVGQDFQLVSYQEIRNYSLCYQECLKHIRSERRKNNQWEFQVVTYSEFGQKLSRERQAHIQIQQALVKDKDMG